jgi:hypothetical protein
VLGLQHSALQIDVLALACSAALAVLLLRRLPPGNPQLPAVRVTLALVLAWLLVTPQQHGWYFALVFPLLAVMPASRLDWIVITLAAVAALAEAPVPVAAAGAHPAWLAAGLRAGYSGGFPVALAAGAALLLWWCAAGRWGAGGGPGSGRHRLLPDSAPRIPGELS